MRFSTMWYVRPAKPQITCQNVKLLEISFRGSNDFQFYLKKSSDSDQDLQFSLQPPESTVLIEITQLNKLKKGLVVNIEGFYIASLDVVLYRASLEALHCVLEHPLLSTGSTQEKWQCV